MIRLIFVTLLFLISLLTVIKAPEYHLWLLAIGVTEFPWLFAGVTLLLLALGFWVGKYQLAGTIVACVALLLFLSPIARACMVAGGLKNGLEESLNNTDSSTGPVATPNSEPYSLFKMFAGTPKVAFRTLPYITYADTTMKLDFYPTQIMGKRPCVIIVHGGSWSSGDSQQLPELNSYLATQGYNVASINYRMAPKWQSPAPVEDVANAIKYLTKNGAELHIDTSRFVLLGRSAGAQIALLAAYTLHNAAIKGVIDFYGPADMVWGYSIPSNPLIMDSRGVMDSYIGGSYAQVPEKFKASSPLEYVDAKSPPTLIIHGENDVLVAYEHSRRLNEKLQKYKIKHFWLKLPWATHGFDYNLNGPGGQLSTYAVLTFLNTITKP